MPSVTRYEKAFDKIFSEIKKPDGMFEKAILANGGIDCHHWETKRPLLSAVAILEKAPCSEYKEYAVGLASIIASFTVDHSEFSQKLRTDKNFAALFASAVVAKSGLELTKLSSEEKNQMKSEIAKEGKSPSLEVRNLCIALYIDGFIKSLALQKEGSFSSYCFVIVKKLDVPVSKETCQKIIDHADFSLGFMHRNSANTRKAIEQAWANSRTILTFKPTPTLSPAP
jgi:hypothetical protein